MSHVWYNNKTISVRSQVSYLIKKSSQAAFIREIFRHFIKEEEDIRETCSRVTIEWTLSKPVPFEGVKYPNLDNAVPRLVMSGMTQAQTTCSWLDLMIR